MLFLAVCALFLVLGCLAVFFPSPLYAAFLLVFWLVVLAGIYLYLNFEFLAVLQVLIYAGAIMVLFIFTIMLLDTREVIDRFEINWINLIAIPFFGAIFFMLFPILKNWVPTKTQPDFQLEDVASGLIQTKLGEYFYSQMFLVFQALGVLIFFGVMAALLITPALQKNPSCRNRSMDNPASILLPLAFALFLIGFYGFLTRKNAFTAFICIEVMLNSANLSLVVFSSAYFKLGGMLMVVVLIVLAALDAVIGLSLIWLLKQLTGKTELKILALD